MSITYDSNPVDINSLWDFKNWEDSVSSANDLIWDDNLGNAVSLLNDEYKPLSIKINLDKLETFIVSREV